jgi:hypothetical protein
MLPVPAPVVLTLLAKNCGGPLVTEQPELLTGANGQGWYP